ncbi:MAG: hypothetical protein KBD63_02280 [Bacteriovoracaceae bacterium]|nr:hypothetical protein [Bacteriovoracaceae bacterium]
MGDFEYDEMVECFEKYYGDASCVKKIMESCSECGAKLTLNHFSDYRSLLILETASCAECGGKRKVAHVLN